MDSTDVDLVRVHYDAMKCIKSHKKAAAKMKVIEKSAIFSNYYQMIFFFNVASFTWQISRIRINKTATELESGHTFTPFLYNSTEVDKYF